MACATAPLESSAVAAPQKLVRSHLTDWQAAIARGARWVGLGDNKIVQHDAVALESQGSRAPGQYNDARFLGRFGFQVTSLPLLFPAPPCAVPQ